MGVALWAIAPVTVITNVASYCGENAIGVARQLRLGVTLCLTIEYSRGRGLLVDLNRRFSGSAVTLNILTFPCDQFGNGHAKEKEAAELLGNSE